MNEAKTRAMLFFILGNVVRDTIEYGKYADSYSLEVFNNKKNFLANNLKENTALTAFCANNGDQGKKLLDDLKDLYNFVYSEDSKLITIRDDKVYSDSALFLDLFEKVENCGEQVNNVIFSHMLFLRKEKLSDGDFEKLYGDYERFYRSVLWIVLMPCFNKMFGEFSSLMKESKGQMTPQAKFVANDLARLFKIFSTSKASARVIDREYTDVLDAIFDFLEMTQGKRVPREGRNMQMDSEEVFAKIQTYTKKYEQSYNEQNNKMFKLYVEPLTKTGEANKA